MKPDTAQRVAAFGLPGDLDRSICRPAATSLRVGAREENTKKAGSVSYDLEVPDFTKEPLLMSGLALTSAASSRRADGPLEGPAAAAAARPARPPTVSSPRRTKWRCSPRSTTTPPTGRTRSNIRATLRAEGGQSVFQTSEERDSTELKGSTGGYGFAARIPLKDVAPGLYVLRVEAQSQLGDRPMVARETVIRVAPTPAERGQ